MVPREKLGENLDSGLKNRNDRKEVFSSNTVLLIILINETGGWINLKKQEEQLKLTCAASSAVS